MELKTFTIHPTAEVSKQTNIGPGTFIWNNCQVRENVSIGRGSILGKDVYVDFDVQIGDHVKIQNGAYIYHGTKIESGVFIGPGVIFTNDKRPRAINPDGTIKASTDWEVSPIRVCYGASIGAGTIILPNVTIGKFAMVGAGSVVTHSVADHALVIGNPARQVGYVCKCGEKLIREGLAGFACPSCGGKYQF